ncbi:MAG: hypothetical protein AAGJ81_05390 [Verrucomicrobiota bacterium]
MENPIHLILSSAVFGIAILLASHGNASTLDGTLDVAGPNRFVRDVEVTLFEASEFTPIALATTTTDSSGQFQFDIGKDTSNSIFFLSATLRPGLRMLAILGEELPATAVINELTTVASAYTMAQFYRTGQIAGNPFRLQIASQMYGNIVNPVSGGISDVLLNPPNSDQTNSLRLTRSLNNLMNGCVRRGTILQQFLDTATDEFGRAAMDTAEAFANLARQPAKNAETIYDLSRTGRGLTPTLSAAPVQWTIAVKVNNTGDPNIPFGGVANVDWDSRGYAWVGNNVTQGTPNSTNLNVVLKPDGSPSDGTNGTPLSPIGTGGLLGVGWGTSVDQNDNAWFGNFGWTTPVIGDTDLYYPSQTPSDPNGAQTGSVSHFAPDGTALSAPSGYFGPYRVQAIEPDVNGNIWMASFGDATNEANYPNGSGVWVFRDGDPNDQIFSITDPKDAPFGIAPVPDGDAAWVTFSGGLAGTNPVSLARYDLVGDSLQQTFLKEFDKSEASTLKVVIVDYAGNVWFSSQGTDEVFAFDTDGNELGQFSGGGIFGPWGLAVDGSGNIWVSNFGPIAVNNVFDEARLSQICGANPAGWPEGLSFGDPITPETGYTLPSEGEPVTLSNGDPLFGPGAAPNFTPMMRSTSVQIDAAGNVWVINNWKPPFNTDATTNPGGDGLVIFVGLAPPPPLDW